MSTYTYNAELRTETGTGASRRLRREDKVPAILYGADKEAASIVLAHKDMIKAQEDEGFYTHILTLNIGGESVEAILKDIQRHPFKPKITHLDFQRVDASHKLHTKVPVHFIGEEKVTKAGNTVVHQLTEIEITCLPKSLPEFVEVNVADLVAGDSIHLSDLKLPAGVSSVELAKGADHDQSIVTVKANKAAPAEEASEDAAE
ncbi:MULTISPECIES: 50S ribosomal protein L25/general stress protein Ctc [Pseudoalteromonas]|jgi:large subunit ribosomal protein L25|uniref:Large ribosomal subunit protein bL25 n=1 Tax=Pseudoalteromonas lipolytica TaxID=570156 RepID=A0AAD0S069_9GAMM|nr:MULTISPECIES: 50S ribosomal protein L25/general stress protein Ctc [Pseudoalteromonas]MAE02433.1 50S ribosomal protein L25 [Pseudoalteromonas sp.]AXV65656.1 50S ribosomal protein L25/general stress protein Ctc [Pseudoalteromonas donghaensis]EWH06774.1 50S ribosomal protein L25 [Pseudoalteromonas lipolytica SCSIO 04301]MBE0349994.1 large subunit ribosomal protein L25 [Pseudoalteromonas lipolytica LMEB 39]MCC9659166.1 50S ribosomal protein L25/general stress protein Ctc [Pseudoalteromonas sp.|tara:strand:+ start:558 stop:1166 length:609 start_codon:yes stop_codon:yes gene_type:complete